MPLYLIGIGLSTEKDISVRGLEIVRKCSKIYLENYTSLLQCSIADLEKLYGKKLIPAGREMAENNFQRILEEARTGEIAFLIIGDPFSATTHTELFLEAKKQNVPVQVLHNSSILTAIGITGLQLYKFGRTASLPFREDYQQLESPYNILRANMYLDMHTLFLLDLLPEQGKYMTIAQALDILQAIEKRKKEKVIQDSMRVIGCARLGREDYVIRAGPLEKIKAIDFGRPLHCLIIPAKKLHFAEEEMLGLWK